MKPLEIIILVGAIALVVFTIVFNIVRKKKGKTSCGCSTGACSSCKGCPYAGKENKEDK